MSWCFNYLSFKINQMVLLLQGSKKFSVNKAILGKYASLLLNYCLELQPGEKLLVNTTTLAEPLVKELFEQSLKKGVMMEVIFDWQGKAEAYAVYGHELQARYVSPLYREAVESYDGYLVIRAPFLSSGTTVPATGLTSIRSEAIKDLNKLYFERTATRSLKRNLCQYPTEQGAKSANMILDEYTDFIINACYLNEDNPDEHWVKVREVQQSIVDHLNICTSFRYQSNVMDISFNTEGRTWINSDGKTNMPSGEVYTSPVENSVNGFITFTLPSLYQGHLLNNVRLDVKDGYIEQWSCDNNIEVLDDVFKIEGSRRFGEAAIGTNYRITQLTKNILYDEKIGGTVHMAIGQSYLQAGGKNESTLHWDMITDMVQGGKIYADDHLIYQNGRFLI